MNCSDIDVNYTIGCKKFSTKIIDVRKRLYFFQIPRKQPQKKKTFLEIVKPVIIRPRQGDAETGNFKLKKALFAKKVGKNYRSIYLEQRILDQEARTKSSLASYEDISSSENDTIEDKTRDDEQKLRPKEEITQKLMSKTSENRTKSNWQGLRPQLETPANGFQLKALITSIPKIMDRNVIATRKAPSYEENDLLNDIKVKNQENELKNICTTVIMSNRSSNTFDWKSDNKTLKNQNFNKFVEIKCLTQENQHHICIPLPFDSDINGTGGAWRVWSCILLAHLIKDAIKSVCNEPNLIEVVSRQSDAQILKSNMYGKLYKRGKYQTKCPKKYCWQRSISNEEYEDDKVQSSKCLEFRAMLNTVS